MNIPLEGEPISPLIALRNCTLKSEKEKKKKTKNDQSSKTWLLLQKTQNGQVGNKPSQAMDERFKPAGWSKFTFFSMKMHHSDESKKRSKKKEKNFPVAFKRAGLESEINPKSPPTKGCFCRNQEKGQLETSQVQA